jgi:hypothetical protein
MAQSNYIENVRGFLSLFNPLNKGKSSVEGKLAQDLSEEVPEFELSMPDDEILDTTHQWEDAYFDYQQKVSKRQKENYDYWRGRQFGWAQGLKQGTRPIVDNQLFNSVETFVPMAIQQPPDALVYADDSPQGQQMAKTVQAFLKFQADRLALRLKVQRTVRVWTLEFVGALKVTWDAEENDIGTEVVHTEHLIFDKDYGIDENGLYKGSYVGQYKYSTAKRLSEMFPKKKDAILAACQGNLAKVLTYTEWWTAESLFFTLGRDVVLGKYRNPHWNYDAVEQQTDPETGEVTSENEVQGKNHLQSPRIPYVFLSVFTTGQRPHDDTNLVEQNLANQDMVNAREKQIDKNVRMMNNAIVLSGKSFTKEQASEASDQLARGNSLWVPEGPIGDSYQRSEVPGLPADVFNDLRDRRSEMKDIFGISGSTPEGSKKEDTVRGKILNAQLDTSRIGGGVTSHVEQMVASLYDYWVQMFYVHYTEVRTAVTLGEDKAAQFYQLVNTQFGDTRLMVTVKGGSSIPKDPLTKRNEAIDLWNAEAIDPISLFSALDDPDPYEKAKQLLVWSMVKMGTLPPTVMFPDWQQPAPVQPGQPPGQGQIAQGTSPPLPTPPVDPAEAMGQQLVQSIQI